jgi:hypothetical protein
MSPQETRPETALDPPVPVVLVDPPEPPEATEVVVPEVLPDEPLVECRPLAAPQPAARRVERRIETDAWLGIDRGG